MNKKIVRIITAGLLAAMLLSCFAGCGSQDSAAVTTAAADTESAAAETSADELRPAIPDDLDLAGADINILNGAYFEMDKVLMDASESTGDVVNDAVYERNLKVMSDLNCNFNIVSKSQLGGDSIDKLISSSVLAGSNDYDFVIGVQYLVTPLVLQNMYINLYGAPYIDISEPWWSDSYINEVTVGTERLYFLAGDISLAFMRNQSCAYYNKTLYQNLFGDPAEMYDTVIDGKWTMDKLYALSDASYSDLNGDSASDKADQFGAGVIASNITDHFTFDAGVRATTRGSDGIPKLTMNNEHTISFTEKLYELYYNCKGTYVFPSTEEALATDMPLKFMNDQLLFMFEWLYSADYLRDMQSDYGIIPYPKFDENQEQYLSLIHDVASITCVPATCDKLDAVCAVMELLAYYGYKSVTPAYYEVALKTKYVRDSAENALQIIDIIHDAATTDFAYIYNYALNGIGLIERDIIAGKKSDFASYYAKKEEKTLLKLDELIELYTSLN